MGSPNRTAFIALVVLDDAIGRLKSGGPLKPPEHGVRLALACLYAMSLTKNRAPFDSLWLILLGRDLHAAETRTTRATTQFTAICEDIGVPHDINLTEALAKGRDDSTPSPQRPEPPETT